MSSDTETSGRLLESSAWMCFVEASPARTFLIPGPESESVGPGADYGRNTCESLAWYDLDSSSWRTYQGSLDGEWGEFSETWPAAGMTQNGRLFTLPMLGHPTSASDYGFLPTPCATETKDSGRANSLANCDRGGRVLRRLCLIARNLGIPMPLDPIRIHPGFLEHQMGYPIGHTELNASATLSFPKSPNGSDTK